LRNLKIRSEFNFIKPDLVLYEKNTDNMILITEGKYDDNEKDD